jgi:SAM-dependent methyltransferase
MRVGVYGQNLFERLALALGLVPRPYAETFFTILLARSVMVGCRVGVFAALAGAPRTAEEVAQCTGTDGRATRKLLDALVASRYLRFARGRYSLARVARRWLLPDAATSLHDSVLFHELEWRRIEGYEDFVRCGKPVELHARLSEEDWALYQRGMRAIAGPLADEVARRLPVPAGAMAMLDIGGSHGLYSVRLCQRHPGLRSTILDLPDAVRHAAPILAREGMGDRVVHRAGDALGDDLGENAFDLVFISNLLHHFDEAANRALAKRIARALRPGGVFAVLEPPRPASPGAVGQGASLLDLYFAMTSGSGTWSLEEMQSWQREAGLAVERPIRLRRVPAALVVAKKRGRSLPSCFVAA